MTDDPGAETLVIFGANLADATAAYHSHLVDEPERVFGRNVRIVLPHVPSRAQGLKVDDYIATPRAREHRNAEEVLDTLSQSVLLAQCTKGDK